MKTSYDKIADEYYDPIHKTSRNFDSATLTGIRQIDLPIPQTGLVLEIGAGRGRSNEFLSISAERTIQLDSSEVMLTLSPREPCLLRILHKAETLPFMEGEFSVVNSFLCDGYFGLEFLSEAFRVTQKGGLFIGTIPSFEWATGLRQNSILGNSFARFMKKDGEEVVVTSNIVPEKQLVEMLNHVGFPIENINISKLKLPTDVKPISPDIQTPAERAGVPIHEFDIIYLFWANK
jgi:SAM-dependent methyltransferase